MKRFSIALLALARVFSLAACGGGGGSTGGDGGSKDAGGSGSGSGEAITAIEDLQAALENDYADAPWFADITGMTLETYLGAPALAIHVTYSNADPDWEARNERRNALITAVQGYDIAIAPNVALIDADGIIAQI